MYRATWAIRGSADPHYKLLHSSPKQKEIRMYPQDLGLALVYSFDPRYRGNLLRSEVISACNRGNSVSRARLLRSDVSKHMSNVRGNDDPRYRGMTVHTKQNFFSDNINNNNNNNNNEGQRIVPREKSQQAKITNRRRRGIKSSYCLMQHIDKNTSYLSIHFSLLHHNCYTMVRLLL